MASEISRSLTDAYVESFNAQDRDVNQAARHIPNNRAADWLWDNVPVLDIPDKVMERTYYFRWWTFRKHIRPTADGFVISEFLADVPWAGKHNTISCAAGHHFYEGRWLRERAYLDQYLDFWFEGGGAVRSYSFWAADAAYQRYAVTGDAAPLLRHFRHFVDNFHAWEAERGDASGLFRQTDDREGMELSMGGTGLRPNVNSYMYAEATAISAIASLAGDAEQARLFSVRAEAIRDKVLTMLWDTHEKFFKTFVTEADRKIQRESYQGDNAYTDQPLGLGDVPELFGYTPWYYGLLDGVTDADYLQAWRFIIDKSYFAGKKGLATAPLGHPLFMRAHHHECAWDGPSWPFATTQALGAMARMLRNLPNGVTAPVCPADFMRLMAQYAAAHRLKTETGSIDWIDENYDPRTGEWLARQRLYEWDDPNKDRGQYYNHSTFCDLVLSDVLGLRPQPDHTLLIAPLALDWDYFRVERARIRGRNVCVSWDKDGTRYGEGPGLRVTVDGEQVSCCGTLGRLNAGL